MLFSHFQIPVGQRPDRGIRINPLANWLITASAHFHRAFRSAFGIMPFSHFQIPVGQRPDRGIRIKPLANWLITASAHFHRAFRSAFGIMPFSHFQIPPSSPRLSISTIKTAVCRRVGYICGMEPIPYKKIVRLGCIVSPLFGIFGATPVLLIEQVDLTKIPLAFLMITFCTATFWTIHFGLVKASLRWPVLRREWQRFLISMPLALVVVVSIVTIVLTLKLIPQQSLPPLVDNPKFQRASMLFPIIQSQAINLLVFVMMEMILLKDRKDRMEEENSQLKLANLEARNNQLQQQMHPHFLFNSLNTLRSLINRRPEQAEDYLVQLSELLRYSINNSTQTTVLLQEELNLCTNYLMMQQVRFGEALQYEIDVPLGMLKSYKVPVYSLQLLIENAIKHNILTKEQPLHIHITANERLHSLTVSNNLQAKNSLKSISGIGLANLMERYQLLGQPPIDIQKTEQDFIVTIFALPT
jgi:two-component system, LytTR family, sensor kinase